MKTTLFICSLLLFIALANLPIGYYTFLRIAITIGAVSYIISEFDKGFNFWLIAFVLIAIIFNPLVPVYLNDKQAWMPIDIIGGLLFLVRSVSIKSPKTKSD
jgi:uncharacterized membrane protein